MSDRNAKLRAEAPPALDATPEQIVSELQTAIDRASELLRALSAAQPNLAARRVDDAGSQVQELRSRLSDAEADLAEISHRLVETEHQRGRLMNLYVATYQLHATMDLDEVKQTIAEIARDLLGAEQFVLLLREGEGDDHEIALTCGLEKEPGPFAGPAYRGGEEAVDQTLQDGVLRMGGDAAGRALAVVPLTVQGVTVGAIVILKLFAHKPSLDAEDRDLLDLLAAHAASALFAARVYSTTDRRLRTLEGLVKLVRGD